MVYVIFVFMVLIPIGCFMQVTWLGYWQAKSMLIEIEPEEWQLTSFKKERSSMMSG